MGGRCRERKVKGPPSSRHRSPHGLAPVPFAIPLTSPRRDSDRFHSALRAGFAGETGPAARGEKSEGTSPVSDRSLPTLHRSTPYRRPKASGPLRGGWRDRGNGRHRGSGTGPSSLGYFRPPLSPLATARSEGTEDVRCNRATK